MKIFGETKNVRCKTKVTLGIKNIVEGAVQKWLVFIRFFEKNLSKVANLDQKTCKKKTMKGKLGKESITSPLYKINKYNLSKFRQSKPCYNSRPRFWLFCFKDSRVAYFKLNMLGFVSEIVSNFVELPWLNTEAVACRYYSKWIRNRRS